MSRPITVLKKNSPPLAQRPACLVWRRKRKARAGLSPAGQRFEEITSYDVEHFAKSVSFDAIAANDYNLSVSSYIEAKDKREVADIGKVNAELKITVAKIDQLRRDIDAIVAEIEGSEA